MSLRIRLEREHDRDGQVTVKPGSVRAPDKHVVQLRLDTKSQGIMVELNKSEAETLANALRAGVR